MTTPNQARETIYSTFETGIGTTIGYIFDNEKFDTDGSLEWVRFTVRHVGGGQDTLGEEGNRKYLRRGLVAVQIYNEVDKGLERADQIAKLIRDLFEGKTLTGGIAFTNSDFREVGDDPPWYQSLLTIDFQYEEIR